MKVKKKQKKTSEKKNKKSLQSSTFSSIFPWEIWLGWSVQGYGILPEAFWRLSFREWCILMHLHDGDLPLSRQEFKQLITCCQNLTGSEK